MARASKVHLRVRAKEQLTLKIFNTLQEEGGSLTGARKLSAFFHGPQTLTPTRD